MEIRSNAIVPLGYGKYARADKIIALDPIEEESQRGPGGASVCTSKGSASPSLDLVPKGPS